MGLDIHIGVDNYEAVYGLDYIEHLRPQHRLSRTFCNFMCRQNVVSHQPELDQIGALTGIDISVFYEMENYPNESEMDFLLNTAANEEERRQIQAEAAKRRLALQGNMDKVLGTLTQLMEKLHAIENLPSRLEPTDFDTLDSINYFANYIHDPGDGYINNNFGLDLMNFQRFLEYAKTKGTSTVWFVYG